ncbi:hypothetical protein AB0L40_03000 [Patulibacter sp. NPDC049589]|uniref:hypothetical protein n=1 Tax=Patulibacter sp. NPDC049589 TaxID=3154731 RepID=UPI0034259D70
MPQADRRYGAAAHTAAARRAARAAGLLRQVQERREFRDRAASAAEAGAGAPQATDEERRRLRALSHTAQQALDTAVMMALADRTPPPDHEIAAAAGVDAYGLEHVRQRLSGPGRTGR